MSLSRLYGGSGKKSSGRPSTANGSIPSVNTTNNKDIKEKEDKSEKDKKPKAREPHPGKERDPKDPALLRKRTSSTEAVPSQLKPGQSVLDQIGESDHSGWMRKKGDRYNSWKTRYFALKGPHLYILKSNAKSVSTAIYNWKSILNLPFTGNQNQRIHQYRWIQGTRR